MTLSATFLSQGFFSPIQNTTAKAVMSICQEKENFSRQVAIIAIFNNLETLRNFDKNGITRVPGNWTLIFQV